MLHETKKSAWLKPQSHYGLRPLCDQKAHWLPIYENGLATAILVKRFLTQQLQSPFNQNGCLEVSDPWRQLCNHPFYSCNVVASVVWLRFYRAVVMGKHMCYRAVCLPYWCWVSCIGCQVKRDGARRGPFGGARMYVHSGCNRPTEYKHYMDK